MSFQPPYLPPGLSNEIRQWLTQNYGWYLRTDTVSDDQSAIYFYTVPSYYRHATADEVATEIVSSPNLRDALAFLASSQGQTIEEAVAQLWLPGWQAALLTDALTLAWQDVLDQNRPTWQRTDILVGAIALIAFFGLHPLGRQGLKHLASTVTAGQPRIRTRSVLITWGQRACHRQSGLDLYIANWLNHQPAWAGPTTGRPHQGTGTASIGEVEQEAVR